MTRKLDPNRPEPDINRPVGDGYPDPNLVIPSYEMTDEECKYVSQRIKDILTKMIQHDYTFYSYGEFYFMWNGPGMNDFSRQTSGCALSHCHDPENLWWHLKLHGFVKVSDWPFKKTISLELLKEIRRLAVEFPHDRAVDREIAVTRSRECKVAIAHNYFWDRFHYYKKDYQHLRGHDEYNYTN